MNGKKKIKSAAVNKFWFRTDFLFYGFFLVGALIILLGSAIGGKSASDSYTRSILLIGFPWIIIACIVAIIRKEIPRLGLSSIKGGWAVFQGVFGITLCGYAEFYLLYILFQEIFSK